MKKRDFYKILGVDKDSSAEEIKKRYRELAKKYHPDTNQGSKKSEEIFKTITAAYDTLGDKKKRQAYDRQQRSGYDTHYESHRSANAHSHTHWQEHDHRQSRTREEPPYDPDTPVRGFDLQLMIDVPIVTVALGGTIPFTYEKYVTCSACDGTGKSAGKKCGTCRGKRQAVASVTIDVDIPAGVADHYTLRVENQGGEGKNGGPPGDLLLKIVTLPHPQFKRVKNDIFAKVNISKKLASEGGVQVVETLDAIRTIPVEEGTLTGEEYRLPGEGAVNLSERKRGDFIIKFFISEN